MKAFRYSLQTVLICVALVAALWALLRPERARLRPADRIVELGGDVSLVTTEAPGRTLHPSERYYSVTIAEAWRGTNDDLALLPALGRVEFVSVWWSGLTDRGLAHIGTLRTVENLDLAYGRVSADGLARLRDVPTLRWLTMTSTAVDDSTIEGLRALPALTQLRLVSLPIRGQRFDALPASLVLLGVTDCPIDDDGMRRLRHLPRLAEVNLNRTQVTEAGVWIVGTMPNMRRMVVDPSFAPDLGERLNEYRRGHLNAAPVEFVRAPRFECEDSAL
jgi:hypothetical protein